jgi:histidyl-tRNA synthetase
MRILDSKDPRDRPAADSAPDIDAFLTSEAQDFFGQVTQGLDAISVQWTRNPRLVRGLDYYRHTAFEFITDRLGAQATVLGGGRYDGLIEALGGPPTPAVGWAAGIERLAMLCRDVDWERVDIAFVPIGERAEREATRQCSLMRSIGWRCDLAYRGNTKKRMQRANAIGAEVAVIFGDAELDSELIKVKHLETGHECTVSLSADLGDVLHRLLDNPANIPVAERLNAE